MPAPRRQTWLSPQDYLSLERDEVVRHEYVDGERFEMVGASKRHGRIVRNLILALDQPARAERLELFFLDLKVRVDAANAYYYPDLVLTTAGNGSEDDYVIHRPLLIAEVLSPGTEAIDRREKRLNYQKLPSLQELLLVSQDRPQVELYRRQADGWLIETISGDQRLTLETLNLALSLDLLYREG